MDQESKDIYQDLMDSATEALNWAKEKAEEFLVYANELEERANTYRKLSAVLVVEARSYCDETADLLMAEFPMGDDGKELDGSSVLP